MQSKLTLIISKNNENKSTFSFSKIKNLMLKIKIYKIYTYFYLANK